MLRSAHLTGGSNENACVIYALGVRSLILPLFDMRFDTLKGYKVREGFVRGQRCVDSVEKGY